MMARRHGSKWQAMHQELRAHIWNGAPYTLKGHPRDVLPRARLCSSRPLSIHQVFQYMSLWGTFLTLTTAGAIPPGPCHECGAGGSFLPIFGLRVLQSHLFPRSYPSRSIQPFGDFKTLSFIKSALKKKCIMMFYLSSWFCVGGCPEFTSASVTRYPDKK